MKERNSIHIERIKEELTFINKAIENMTGLKVVEVNVYVQGVNVEKQKDKDAEAAQPRVK